MGQRIVLTGAASGIGAALLKELAQFDSKIVCADISEEHLLKTCHSLIQPKAEIIPFVGDLSQKATIDRLFDTAAEQMGTIDLFIANAGIAYYEEMNEPNWERMEKLYYLNVFSPIYATQKMKLLHPQTHYCVVLVSSAMAYISIPGYTLYASTKAAIDRFEDGYRFELPPYGRLMTVYPVATRTHFFARAGRDVPIISPTQTPEFVAKSIISGLVMEKRKVFPSYTFRWLRFSSFLLFLMRSGMQFLGHWQFKRWQETHKNP